MRSHIIMDMQRPGFDMMVGDGPSLAGCAYGYQLEREGALWQGFRGGVPKDLEELTASGQVMVLAELMVLPEFRRRRVASRLVKQLLIRSRSALVAALAEPANTPVIRAFQDWGWHRLGEVQLDQDNPSLEAWGREVEHAGSAG